MRSSTQVKDMRRWVGAARTEDIPEGEMMAVSVEGRKIALYHLENGEFHASANVCTHEFALLTDGWLEGCEVECPLHAGRFDVRTGQGLCAPIERDLETFETEIRDGEIFVALPDN